jgi:hypothetical protein
MEKKETMRQFFVKGAVLRLNRYFSDSMENRKNQKIVLRGKKASGINGVLPGGRVRSKLRS